MAKKIVNIRLRPDQEERINAIVERSAILDTSKFVRIAVDWLLRSDIGEAIKTIVGGEAFPDYAMRKNPLGKRSKGKESRDVRNNQGVGAQGEKTLAASVNANRNCASQANDLMHWSE
jgi:hypothetical protein